MKTQDALWQQVAAFQFGDRQSALTFTQRLARENGWSQPFAKRVVEEHRRFIYLAARAGHPVTPSDEVDQAWHLHMVYTQSYWEDLCRDVLGKPMHHGPTKGGKEERDKFHDWYEATLTSYRRLFHEEPPSDIWPPSTIRFSTRPQFQRVDLSDAWIISKKRLKHAFGLGIGASALVTLLMACQRADGKGIDCSATLLFILVLAIVLAIIHSAGNSSKGGRSDGGGGCDSSGCSSSDGGSHGSGHSGCGSHGGGSGCGSDSGSSGCGSSCGGGCGGGGD